MRERPILFSAAMVQAILDNRKSQTRRLVEWVPIEPGLNLAASSLKVGYYCTGVPSSGFVLRSMSGSCWNDRTKPLQGLNAVPGDRLWVREAWRTGSNFDKWGPNRIAKEAADCGYRRAGSITPVCPIWYEADGYFRRWSDNDIADFGEKGRLRPSIHMPRWASRISLEITGVQVERLQDISEADARAEGITDGGCLTCGESEPCGCGEPKPDARDAFAWRWSTIHASDGPHGWLANPWVWVVEFRRIV